METASSHPLVFKKSPAIEFIFHYFPFGAQYGHCVRLVCRAMSIGSNKLFISFFVLSCWGWIFRFLLLQHFAIKIRLCDLVLLQE